MQTYLISFLIASLIFFIVLGLNKIFLIQRNKLFEKKLEYLKTDNAYSGYFETINTKKTFKEIIYLYLAKIKNNISLFNNNTIMQSKQKFERCGWDSEYAEIITPIAIVLLTLAFVCLYFLIYYMTPYLIEVSTVVNYVIFILFTFVGIRSYEYIIDFYASIRIKKLEKDISMVIDLLSICAQAGLNFDRSLEKIAQEIVHINYPLSHELSIAAAELLILPDRSNAYNNMFKRIPLDIIRALSISMIYAEQHGISVSKTLNTLAEENTKKLFFKIEEKAGKLPAKMTVPIILFSIPIIGMIVLGPAVHQISTSSFFAN